MKNLTCFVALMLALVFTARGDAQCVDCGPAAAGQYVMADGCQTQADLGFGSGCQTAAANDGQRRRLFPRLRRNQGFNYACAIQAAQAGAMAYFNCASQSGGRRGLFRRRR